MPPLETMIKELTSGTEAARQTALAWLVDLIDGLPTAELLSVCAELRESGACAMLVKLLAVPALHEDALLVLSNIAADAVDVHAKQTRELLKREDVMNSIFPYLWTESYESVLYALAALVHFVDDVSQIQGLLIASARLRLQQIVEEGDDMLATFATSCIKRMPEATAMEKEAVRAAEEQRAALEAALPDTESEGEKARALIQRLASLGSKIDQLRFPDLTRAHTHTSHLTFAQGTAEVKRRGDPNLTVSASMPTLPSLRSLQHAPDTEAHESVPEQRRQSPQPMRSEQEAKREALAEARRKAAAQAEARRAAKEAEEMKEAARRALVAKKDGDDDSDGVVEVF
eukprot:jgi/Chrpa1/14958/Chrysochromulina_OHIO_Genome00024020-RA